MTLSLLLPISCYHASSSSSAPTAGRLRAIAHVGRHQAGCLSSAATLHTRSNFLFATSPGSPSYTASSSQSQKTETDGTVAGKPCSGFSVIEEFYRLVNLQDFESVAELIAEDCIYEDLVFEKPFVGRKALVDFVKKFTAAGGPNLQFVIDDISKEDPVCIGVTWHLEWDGKPFPSSKGCSFYRLTSNGQCQQISYARDCIEPAVKPGDSALAIIRAVTALLRKFPSLADRL